MNKTIYTVWDQEYACVSFWESRTEAEDELMRLAKEWYPDSFANGEDMDEYLRVIEIPFNISYLDLKNI